MNRFETFAFLVLAPLLGVFAARMAFAIPYVPYGPLALVTALLSWACLVLSAALVLGCPAVAIMAPRIFPGRN